MDGTEGVGKIVEGGHRVLVVSIVGPIDLAERIR